ncbi:MULTISPECIES: tRNA (adenosine(37)-N6)-threonylcarbamoyltransferase complex dimerization subunit type 1 TsaB [unclassified Micromonospora]|uniref:tRNA (adenosine(37)-N6)-threonylcarbamoyltransferase complex dimerization subunit type 1 TsaB n=1 Tax=unclassified Micromonospora TaxID=2617518 RepID=UPI001C5CCBC4|nr:tRNA (adenosine(37)-N6)-threonylcarbamoyltransferase complex dimerization subunit type 1 TsaB [Micromonospora sp. RL09-050-HVF-A]MBW4703215.1 tRNA (adenosine(37)-N6)-threonylcarbamoyltransferase complex dimerization subunit type 1 TsaB [Micromonospora sp. RL09-050-HVF-A]
MLVLVVDSSTPAVTAALVEVTADGVALRAYRCTIDARAHGELLAPQVEAVLTDVDARPGDLGAIVAGLGPGPFTGLRVGLVTAATMGQVLGIPTYGVCSLDGIAHPTTADASPGHAVSGKAEASSATAGPAGTGDATAGQATAGDATGGQVGTGGATVGDAAAGERRVLVAADARRKEVYWAVYDGDGQRIVGPEVDAPAVAAARARELAVTVAAGDGAHRYADVLGLPLCAEPRYPDAVALVTLAAERIRAGAPGETLTPLYLRRPDAVAATSRKSVLP